MTMETTIEQQVAMDEALVPSAQRNQNTQQFSALFPIELTNEEIRNSKAYKEYYAIAIGEAAPKPKASARRTRSGSDTSITPPTAAAILRPAAAVTPRLTAAAKGKQTAKASKSKSQSALPEVAMTEAQQLKLATRRSMQQMLISQPSGSEDDDDENKDVDEKDDADEDQEVAKHDDKVDTEESGDDDEEGGSDEHESNEETQEEKIFDPIPQTPKDSEDEDDGEEDLGLNIGEKERHDEEEEEDELYRDVNINQGRGLQGTLKVEDTHVTLTLVKPDGQRESSSVSSQFMTSMLNPTLDTNLFAGAVSAIPRIVQHYMDQRMNEAVQKIIKELVKEQVKAQVSKILPRIEQDVNEQLEAEVLIRSSHSSKTSYAVAADLFEMELKKILLEKMERSDEQRNLYKALVDAYESDKIILDTYGESVTLKRRRDDDEDKDEEPSAGPDRGSKRRREGENDQPIVQSSQHPEWFSQPQKPPSPDRDWNKTLLVGSCKSLIELEYHLEEVYKATTDQVDWVNPKGQQYPHNLLQPLPLIPDNRGRHVIPFAHFINNDLEYLGGGASSRKYTTSVTKTKAADYGHIKWIEDLFYGLTINRESARDVYSKRRIFSVTELKIVEWHSYKHLDWITVRRENDKLYKFKEGDFKRLRIQDIEDMLPLLRRVEDLQLGVESYQKKLNLTKPDTYRSDLKRKEAYTAYFNPQGFIYQNKDKQNRLMRIDELHKFSEGTLTVVRTALDDRQKGIRMQYPPQTIWRLSDKDRATAMI
nr:hypothetical protein [Tanacetum cinerariifolium]